MTRARCTFHLLSLALLLLLAAGPAFAVGVGPSASCDVRTIQAAIDRILARERNGDFGDTNIVIAGGTYNEALQIGAGGSVLTMTGGYDSGCQIPTPGSVTKITAVNRSASALTVTGGISLTLASLNITGADTGGNGGGIFFDGSGTLDLTHVSIFGNHAARGAGLYANGQSGGLVVRLNSPTTIFNNHADHAGGGARVQGNARLFMLHDNTVVITGNTVNPTDDDGAGGGLQVVGPARADIGSAIITGNSAKHGGGISVDGSGGNDVPNGAVRFFMMQPGQPTRIDQNKAVLGGGIYTGAHRGAFEDNAGQACGFGFSISGNAANQGAAIYVDTDSSFGSPRAGVAILKAFVLTNLVCGSSESATSLGAIDCPAGTVCNTINNNLAQDSSGHPTDGSTIVAQTQGIFEIERAEMRRNVGSHLVHGFETPGNVSTLLSNCLLADNTMTSDFIRTDESGALTLRNCTLTGNAIGGSHVLSLTGDLTLTESLVWQFGPTILQQDGGHQLTVHNVLASEIFTLGGGNTVLALNPQFLSPANGDYHLLPTSPAIDFAPALAGTDLEGRPRTVDLSAPNRPGGGALDLGAYELQALPVFPPAETFDEVTAPALPSGWSTTSATAGFADWFTVSNDSWNAPNAVFVADTAVVTDKQLTTPSFFVNPGDQLTFRHKMNLDASTSSIVAFDAVVLEIKVDGADWQDIFQAGGRFVRGAYDHNISSGSGNPLGGRIGWSGTTADFDKVIINLPAAKNGSSIALRWRLGTDGFVSNVGYWLDDIHLIIPPDDRIFFSCFAALCPD
jgi:hypothetical protein